MAFNNCLRAVPMVTRRLSTPAAARQVRTLFDPWPRVPDIRSVVRDMEHQMNRLEQQFMRGAGVPSAAASIFPRLIPVALDATNDPKDGSHYRMALDMSGFKPQEIDISLDGTGRKLAIKAKCERSGKDGSHFSQEMIKYLTLPESIDMDKLESVLHNDGVLAIEAPFKVEHQNPRQIPISRAEEQQQQAEKIESK